MVVVSVVVFVVRDVTDVDAGVVTVSYFSFVVPINS